MPNLKSAKKRMKTNEVAHQRNLAVRTSVKTSRRNFLEAVEGKDRDVADQNFRAFCSKLDLAAKKNVIKKNTAVRSKTRAAARLAAMA